MGEGLLEGSADRATLERLRWAVVVHHAALGLPFGREEQATEFGHLQREKTVTLVTPADLLRLSVNQCVSGPDTDSDTPRRSKSGSVLWEPVHPVPV